MNQHEAQSRDGLACLHRLAHEQSRVGVEIHLPDIVDRTNQGDAGEIPVAQDEHEPCRGTTASCATLGPPDDRSEEHTSELQSLMRISYAVFCLKQKHNNSYAIKN